MVRLATMNLTLRGLENVRILRRNVRHATTGVAILFVVDASGSMGARRYKTYRIYEKLFG